MSSKMDSSGDEVEASRSLTANGGAPGMRRQMSGMAAAFEAGTWDPEMNMLEPTVNVLVYFSSAPSVDALATAVEKFMWPSHRFNCCMDTGYWLSRHAEMDRSYHFRELQVASEGAIDEWVQTAMMQPLDKDFPVWRVTVLRAPAPARSALFWQLHHAIGDGLSLLFAFSPMMGCAGGDPLAKIPLPNALLPPERRKASAGGGGGGGKAGGCCGTPCAFMKGVLTPVLVKHDTELRINPPIAQRTPFVRFNGRRIFTRFPRVNMDIIKSIKDQHECSVNDVLMAALTGALRRYGAEVCGDPLLQSKSARIDFKSMIMLALPRPIDMNDLAGSLTNKMLFVSCPLPIDEPTVLGRLQRTIAAFGDMKSSAYIAGVAGLTEFVKSAAPTSVLRKTASETFSKHSLLVTNVPSTTVPVTFPKENGEQISETHMVFPNVVPQISIITYNGCVNANIVADPELFPKAEVLGEMFQQEFEALASCDPE